MSTIVPTIPSLGKSESFGLLLVMGLVGFAVYRLYSTGSQLAGGISSTLSGIGSSLGSVVDNVKLAADQVNLDTIKAANAIGGASPPAVADQSAAETARLNALAGNGLGTSAVDPLNDINPFNSGVVGDNIVIGTATDYSTSAQQDSPDASGLSTWLG